MPQHTLHECALQMITSANIKSPLGLLLTLHARFYSSALPFPKGGSLSWRGDPLGMENITAGDKYPVTGGYGRAEEGKDN